MPQRYGFEIVKQEHIAELKTDGVLYRHVKTGAELLSLSSDDTNKVFGITFRTPPSDSTGIAHILEHSVLCGSRKYPVKEPFIELVKGSLQTFLNAFTYPDKTCYPVASQNVTDLYNLIDVYLDAVFFPRITPEVFEQEGWHFELDAPEGEITYKGVVFNEMKGAYSSPDGLLSHHSQRYLFPDTAYGLDSGGDPAVIPDLTFEQFRDFHRRCYQPANSRIYFYGDDDPEERLRFTGSYLDAFDAGPVDSQVALQPQLPAPRTVREPFPAGEGARKGMLTVNWLLDDVLQVEQNMALCVLQYALLGMPGSPLRKALIDSALGDGLAGGGLENELRQMYFSTGLKGIDPARAGEVERLIVDTLAGLARDGIDPQTVDAALNTIEFRLRENNTGQFPRGLSLMLRALTVWLYGGDPFAVLGFERPLQAVRARIAAEPGYLRQLLQTRFLDNPHRLTVIMEPDAGMAERLQREERERLAQACGSLSAAERRAITGRTKMLKALQEQPDTAEQLATIPRLKLADMPLHNQVIPCEPCRVAETQVLRHDLFTNGILYCDVGLNLHLLPQEYMPYVPLLGRALLETGAGSYNFVALSQRISRQTGGIRPVTFTSAVHGSTTGAAWLFLRGKALVEHSADLYAILTDVLTSPRLKDQARFRQIVLEEKAAFEQRLIPAGHSVVASRLRAHFNEADWAAEQMNGVSYYRFLQELEQRVDTSWNYIQQTLEQMRLKLLDRACMIVNMTVDDAGWEQACPALESFLEGLPRLQAAPATWQHGTLPPGEGMLVASRVNYVGKAADLYQSGYRYHGSMNVITNLLRTVYLWEKVRVQGGAYGAFCSFDRLTGAFLFGSYRDPNLLGTLDAFDRAADWLAELRIDEEELARSIIGTIGDIDSYMLPDTKGYVSLQRHLIGITEDMRRQMRREVLSTSPEDLAGLAGALQSFEKSQLVKVLGATEAVSAANAERHDFLKTFEVMD